MKISAGVLIINEFNELLLGHATGQNRWDIPKGQIDEGETPLQAAKRELKEETSLELDAPFKDLGLFNYLPAKKLHLFLVKVPKSSIEMSKLVCTSSFFHEKYQKEIFEMDGFDWVSFEKIEGKTGKSLTSLLLSLREEILG